MASDLKAPEAMEWLEEDAAGGGDKLSRASAPSVERTIPCPSTSHSADQAPLSPGLSLSFLARHGRRRAAGRRTPEPTSDHSMRMWIEKLGRILARFDPKLTASQDKQHLAFSSLPTDILLMAQDQLKVKTKLKAWAQQVGRELA